MEQNLKSHQVSALVFVAGLLFGAVLHYYMFSKTVSYKVEQAYEQGYNFGAESELRCLLDNFNSSDSVSITEEGFHFYKFNKNEFVVE